MLSIGCIDLFLIILGVFGAGSAANEYILGDVNNSGSLRIYSNVYQWTSVCHDGINLPVAHVICRQLGYVRAEGISFASPDDVTSSVYSSIQCPTVSNYELYGETNILRCNITGPFLKTSALECKATLIQCNTDRQRETPYEGQVFLDNFNTATPSDGKLQVYINGGWKAVCYTDAFIGTVADSVCRQFGYTEHIEKRGLVIAGGSGLMFSSYSCNDSTGSFACFSHCVASSTNDIEQCNKQVYLSCAFSSSMKFITSGSKNECVLPSKDRRGLSKVITSSVIAAVIGCAISIILTSIFCGCYKKCCDWRLCCKKYKRIDGHDGRPAPVEFEGKRND